MTDEFPAADFDKWAEHYDQSVSNSQDYPFTGYEMVLEKVVELADPTPGMSVLDLGIGTGNLSLRFDALGCEVWGTDYSTAMLNIARKKLPQAHLFQNDLRGSWPPALNRRFDCILSAYVFHHFKLEEKVEIIHNLINDRLNPNGSLIMADIAFENKAALEAVRRAVGDDWDDEYYWLADDVIPAFAETGLEAGFHLISDCGGVFKIERKGNLIP